MQTTETLPEPSSKHGTCAWCRRNFDTIVELIDHVDGGHLAPPATTVRDATTVAA